MNARAKLYADAHVIKDGFCRGDGVRGVIEDSESFADQCHVFVEPRLMLALCLLADEALVERKARDEAEVVASVSGLMDRLAARGTKP